MTKGIFYRPPTKLREGDVFSRVCHYVQEGSPCDHYPWPLPQASPYRDLRGPYCTGTHLGPTTPAPEHIKFVHYEAHAVGKRAVGILPECILVFQFLCIYTFCELATGTSTVQWSIGDFYFVQSFRSGEVKWRKVITLWRSNSLWPTKV